MKRYSLFITLGVLVILISSVGVFSLIVRKEEQYRLAGKETSAEKSHDVQSGTADSPEKSGSVSPSTQPNGSPTDSKKIEQPVLTPKQQVTKTRRYKGYRRPSNEAIPHSPRVESIDGFKSGSIPPSSSAARSRSNNRSNDFSNDLRKAFSKLRPGQIAFKTPAQMKVDEAEIVEMRITDDLKRDLKSELGKDAEVAQIKVSDFLKAHLDGNNFEVKPIDEKNRALLDGKSVKWRWSVTPTKSGQQTLILIVYARVKLSNESEELVDLKTFERPITVAVNKRDWFKENWDKVIGIPIALGGTGFFAFVASKWRFTKNVLKKNQ
ncbi:hypothetical protein [Mastigocoleus testarum]|uniref:Uncharacterized protein n=1 Tax=Mastigocoleus testarum BC008 TaxID=371196 RepID=A0A0V8A041_9CYAN|nr:hypothetical protein [Mastigocoleus testarum]KST70079.1 hypothetical protein BC008_06480 [Mastigocoleus testarum BC008]KST70110.1 hypothetical protein BC008_06650 [Mastigocoleus testarum BC008]